MQTFQTDVVFSSNILANYGSIELVQPKNILQHNELCVHRDFVLIEPSFISVSKSM